MTGAAPPRLSPRLLGFFHAWLRRYLARHFNAVRVSKAGPPPPDRGRPLVVYSNHPSWWDPLLFGFVVHRTLPGRELYGPMDAAALAKYRILERLGAFGVEGGTRRGAARFLRTGLALLERPRTVLWITARGDFGDARARPVRLRPGVAHLARRAAAVDFVPAAVELVFWNERRPEALIRFGDPVAAAVEGRRLDREAWRHTLDAALERTMDALAAEVIARDPTAFATLLAGHAGVGGVYDLGRRLRAWLRGERFDAGHGFLRGKGAS